MHSKIIRSLIYRILHHLDLLPNLSLCSEGLFAEFFLIVQSFPDVLDQLLILRLRKTLNLFPSFNVAFAKFEFC